MSKMKKRSTAPTGEVQRQDVAISDQLMRDVFFFFNEPELTCKD